jgi:hypothetical protein
MIFLRQHVEHGHFFHPFVRTMLATPTPTPMTVARRLAPAAPTIGNSAGRFCVRSMSYGLNGIILWLVFLFT